MDSPKLDEKKNEIKNKQKKVVKYITKKTLDEIDELEGKKAIVQERIKILKHDLYDLKDGRLDRIADRQQISSHCLTVSMFKVNKNEKSPPTDNPWYIEYIVQYYEGQQSVSIILNNSVTKLHASGSYQLDSGGIKHL